MALIKKPTEQAVTSDQRSRQRDCASLIAGLTDPNPTARRWCARDLAECPEASAELVARLPLEEDASVRDVILTTLTGFRDETAVAGLVACLHSENAALRNEAIEALREMPDEVAPIMRGLLRAADADARIFAVNILESLRHPDVETWLIEVIENDPHVNVCGAAVDLLGEVGTSAARLPLQRLAIRFAEEPYIRFAAELAIKRLPQD